MKTTYTVKITVEANFRPEIYLIQSIIKHLLADYMSSILVMDFTKVQVTSKEDDTE